MLEAQASEARHFPAHTLTLTRKLTAGEQVPGCLTLWQTLSLLQRLAKSGLLADAQKKHERHMHVLLGGGHPT